RLQQEAAVHNEELAAQRDAALAAAEASFPPQIEQNAVDRTAAERANNARYEQRRNEATAGQQQAFDELVRRWNTGFQEVLDELNAIRARAHRLFPDWQNLSWSDWQRPTELPEAISVGGYELPLSIVKHGAPRDPRLAPPADKLPLTAAVSLADRPRLVLTADGPGRRAAVEALQLAMLRMLTTLPAGRLRFTLIDPAGLGESFGPFMHLADYDEQLAPKTVWTEPKRIEERLALITAHMETVLQKYLRNEFATLAEYNAQAGEVAEPYHVIVVANFPTGMTEAAARRLTTIAEAGARCGVYVLMSVDRNSRLPHEFKLEPLLNGAMHLDWDQDHFVWRYPLFERLPLTLDPLPTQEKLTEVLRHAARESREASRVEVAFEKVAPAPDAVWSSDNGRELAVPIGRAGAKELQALRLGRGTSQHVLISGKTGSGKSTLLHALITNAALHYSPEQVEFYLVDFKKGVEFKTYATAALPHARVIAIESEREFGVSVLERLDAELRRRGELFRDRGVQDLAAFRAAEPGTPMPRTLLIVDEFQELFVADDKLAQDAALLLDRLVRQGRAFGVHVILGSQTLAGAYSLARSTLGQMAVRIALECSDTDAHLILSDENPAARLLSRPGEAIYNDQNGLPAGNQPFQVAWLPDEQRRDYLHDLRERPAALAETVEPTVVFEGNIPADPRDNRPLAAALAGGGNVSEPTVWLGAAVRIEPPTSLTLRRQSGQNVAIVGHEESSALGILSAAAAALIGQQRERDAKVIVFDGARPESDDREAWQRIVAALGDGVERIRPRDAAGVITELADDVARRAADADTAHPPRYLIIHDLAQFRDLRLTEDEFSFNSAAKPASPDRRFRDLLREGPGVGIHVLFWCDSYNAMTRVIDRLTLREIDYRIALPMSAGDSTSFIESPAGGRLGEHRAILYRDDLGTQTKFRPYGQPTDERLQWLAAQIKPPTESQV
ncbi:MAG: AAA family ATPase, partial [Planctomycetales bacterium]|nr:AAA family ATPase [Planctomycetales bacterium]